MLERHEIDRLKEEIEAQNDEDYLFFENATSRVTECLLNGGDLVDVINDLDIEFSSWINLSNVQINKIVTLAVTDMLASQSI